MKKIGFIDYYLSEWHANKYPGWMADICKAEGLEYQIAYAWGELEISPVDGISGAQWCEQNGVEQCATIEEVCEKSDVILILAPSNPEKHLEYAKAVLPFGKISTPQRRFLPLPRSIIRLCSAPLRFAIPRSWMLWRTFVL